jgi:tRNA(fMet)-specific endonuclease VapC
MYVLDTNTLIYFFKGMGNVSMRLFDTNPHEIGIPAIVIYELEVGIAKSTSPDKRHLQLKQFTSIVNILPFGLNEARVAASLRAYLEKKGKPIGPHDILIAGTALAKAGTLVTHNTHEFSRINNLKFEDWY